MIRKQMPSTDWEMFLMVMWIGTEFPHDGGDAGLVFAIWNRHKQSYHMSRQLGINENLPKISFNSFTSGSWSIPR